MRACLWAAALAAACSVMSVSGESADVNTGCLEAHNEAFWGLVDREAVVEKLAGSFQFTEGPVWCRDGFLRFSDIPADTIYRRGASGALSPFRKPSGQSNGLTYDGKGRLIACEHGTRSVTRSTGTGKRETLASEYAGHRLNSPNDIAVFKDGSLYFTDPPYGIGPEQQEQPCQGVYRLWPETGDLELLLDGFERPNGIAFSPGYRTLYVADSSGKGEIRSYSVAECGALSGERLFARPNAPEQGTTDGLKTDRAGNVWTTGPGGVWVYSPDGSFLGRIRTPEVPANCAWGGLAGEQLFITARTGLYRIRTLIGGPVP